MFCSSAIGLYPRLYPELSQYMGLSLSDEEVQQNLAVAAPAQPQGVGPKRVSESRNIKTTYIYVYI